jgi:two-component system response regulator YesN
MYTREEHVQFKRYVLQAVRAYKELLDEHCTNGDCTHEIAEKYRISRNALQKGFKKLYGISIREYKLRLRMERSCTLLAACKDIKEVSMMLHYTTPRAFSFAFKKYYGVTPSEYASKLPTV